MKAQVCVLANCINAIGGIETFVYNWCSLMKDTYDIVVAVSRIDPNQLNRLKRIVKVVQNTEPIECDTVVVMHIATKAIPSNIKYKKIIRMVHGCKSIAYSNIAECDTLVPVSDTARISFGEELKDFNTKVIWNPMLVERPKKILKLISATRLTAEKGGQRILEFAKLLKAAGIPYIWYVFSNRDLKKKLKKEDFNGIVEMPPTLNISSWIKECDYLVQLSDTESFGYSIVESLMLGVPVITTPLDVLSEIGVKDGVNGWVVPFDMKNIDVDKIYNSNLKFEYKYDNKSIANEWKEVLGEPKPFVKYIFKEVKMKIKALRSNVTLTVENIKTKKGEIYEVSSDRAALIVGAGYAEYVKEEKKEDAKKEIKVEVAKPQEEKVEKATVKKAVAKKPAAKKTTKKEAK